MRGGTRPSRYSPDRARSRQKIIFGSQKLAVSHNGTFVLTNSFKQTCFNKLIQTNSFKQTRSNKLIQTNSFQQTRSNKLVPTNSFQQTRSNKLVPTNPFQQTNALTQIDTHHTTRPATAESTQRSRLMRV